ncbi:MAG TPA: hypothetical protein VK453_26290 [Micromonosporaceae bacterium]|nr:hypothetical protein [Micromonosporaceae bacterium]
MRSRRLLLAAAAACAAAHTVGTLFAHPVWRYAEVCSLALLLVCAAVSRPPAVSWAVPAALSLLLVNAVRTIPADPATAGYGWQVHTFRAGDEIDTTSGFEAGLTACWASLTAVALLLGAWRRGGWRGPTRAGGVVLASLVTGYAVVRIIDVCLALRAESEWYANAIDPADAVSAVILAVLPALALALTALALATALAGHGRRLASIGAVLLAVASLPLLDGSISAVLLPFGDRTALFTWDAITPTLSMPQPVAALTVALELTAYLLLAAGLTAVRDPTRAAPTEPAG